jgi:hypothetical protein
MSASSNTTAAPEFEARVEEMYEFLKAVGLPLRTVMAFMVHLHRLIRSGAMKEKSDRALADTDYDKYWRQCVLPRARIDYRWPGRKVFCCGDLSSFSEGGIACISTKVQRKGWAVAKGGDNKLYYVSPIEYEEGAAVMPCVAWLDDIAACTIDPQDGEGPISIWFEGMTSRKVRELIKEIYARGFRKGQDSKLR